jgi:hypothetical protein
MAIPGTLAGRWICPWPTQIVIPTTLAHEAGEVSWDSMGLRRVLFLSEVNSRPSKSQGFSFGWKVDDLENKFHRVSPAISGRAGSWSEPARAALRPPAGVRLFRIRAPRDLDPNATCLQNAVMRPIGSRPTILCGNSGGCLPERIRGAE